MGVTRHPGSPQEVVRPARESRDPRAERKKVPIPSWYHPIFHVIATAGLLVAASVLSILSMPTWEIPMVAWFAGLGGFLFASLFEYVLHRFPMHRRMKKLDVMFTHHTIQHHRYFTAEHMELDDLSDIYFVMPSRGVIVSSVFMLAAIYGALFFTLGAHAAGMGAAGVAIYGALSEILHVAYHLPEPWDYWPLRTRWFRWLAAHHRLHHDPRVMRKWNFNIALPIFDVVCRTLAPSDATRAYR